MRHSSRALSSPSFLVDAKNRSYKHQYSNIYFTRLATLKQPVQERAAAKWKDLGGKCSIAPHHARSPDCTGHPVYVPRVLDVVKSQLCWILGTVYMDMPLKPNVLQDLGRDVSAQLSLARPVAQYIQAFATSTAAPRKVLFRSR